MIELPHDAHDAIGIAVFVLVLGAISGIWLRSARREPRPDFARIAPIESGAAPMTMRYQEFFGVACVLALTVAFVPRAGRSEPRAAEFSGFPDRYAGESLTKELAPAELAAFYRQFPGKVAHFRGGSARYVFRWVTEPTRRLHPARHCYRASGYETDDQKSCVRADGERYGCFTARKHGKTVRVSERVYDVDGRSFTDVSAWYWAALLGSSRGPWWVVTIAEAEPETGQPSAQL